MILLSDMTVIPGFTCGDTHKVWSEGYSSIAGYDGNDHSWYGDIIQDACFMSFNTGFVIGKMTSVKVVPGRGESLRKVR